MKKQRLEFRDGKLRGCQNKGEVRTPQKLPKPARKSTPWIPR